MVHMVVSSFSRRLFTSRDISCMPIDPGTYRFIRPWDSGSDHKPKDSMKAGYVITYKVFVIPLFFTLLDLSSSHICNIYIYRFPPRCCVFNLYLSLYLSLSLPLSIGPQPAVWLYFSHHQWCWTHGATVPTRALTCHDHPILRQPALLECIQKTSRHAAMPTCFPY